jgi:hypothetical protein
VTDSEGVIRWSYVSPVGINPGADGILKALALIAQHKGDTAIPEFKQRPVKEVP